MFMFKDKNTNGYYDYKGILLNLEYYINHKATDMEDKEYLYDISFEYLLKVKCYKLDIIEGQYMQLEDIEWKKSIIKEVINK